MAVFYHCADLHIGKERMQSPRQGDFAAALCHIAEKALKDNADCLLISGDLFDKREIDPISLRQVSQALLPLKDAGIAVYAIEGNHDKATYLNRESWLGYLDSQGLLRLLRFGEQLMGPYEEGGNVDHHNGMCIIGLPYSGARTLSRLEQLCEQLQQSDEYTILMLHAPLGRMAGIDYAYIPAELIERMEGKVDYVALGHMHTRYELSFAANPGAPESVDIDESLQGEKGYYRVDTQGERAFIPYAHRPLVDISLDVTDLPDATIAMEELASKIDSLKDRLNGAMTLIQIVGQANFDVALMDTTGLETQLQEYGCVLWQIRFHTNGEMEKDAPQMESREDIEMQAVLSQLGPEQKQLAQLVIGVKNALLHDGDMDETIGMMERYIDEVEGL